MMGKYKERAALVELVEKRLQDELQMLKAAFHDEVKAAEAAAYQRGYDAGRRDAGKETGR